MILLLYGPDFYGKRQKIKEITGEYQKKHPFLNVEHFDFDNDSDKELSNILKFKDFFSNQTLFGSVKLAVAENVLQAAKENKEIKKILKSNLENKDLVLIICEEKKPIKEFAFLLEKPVRFQEFENLKGGQFEQFIKKEVKARDLEIEDKAVLSMSRIFEGDIWGLVNGLDKLLLLNKKIGLKEFYEIIDCDEKANFSDFFRQVSNFAFSRTIAQKIVNLEILFETGDPAKIFNFLASFSSNPLDLIRKFADYDVAIKSGKMDYEEALVDLAIS
ncbi:hypothetical protein HZB04_00395 [Candidatus Wolfebacteria bacterium]|nr:hypothetical protein [Candidatus Wolfebacteria bacterium]